MRQSVALVDAKTLRPIRRFEGFTFRYKPYAFQIADLTVVLAKEGYELSTIEVSEESNAGGFPVYVDILVIRK